MKRRQKPLLTWIAVIFLIVLLPALVSSIVVLGGGWGLASKSLWDWMELLIIPLVLALGAWWLQGEERKSEQRASVELDRRNLLETYFDRMQELLLEHGLLNSNSPEEIVEIARARTLHVLRSLDGERKGHVIRFLVDSGALAKKTKNGGYQSAIRLSYADLSNANLENVHLEGVNLWCANLENANLSNSHLVQTNLPYAFMKGAILNFADLSGACLNKAVVEQHQLEKALQLKDAIMPDNQSFEEWTSAGKPDWTRGMPQTWTPHHAR
jgi:hypothetical protein